MPIIKKMINAGKDCREWDISALLIGTEISTSTMFVNMNVHQNIEIEISYDLALSFGDSYLKKAKATYN